MLPIERRAKNRDREGESDSKHKVKDVIFVCKKILVDYENVVVSLIYQLMT